MIKQLTSGHSFLVIFVTVLLLLFMCGCAGVSSGNSHSTPPGTAPNIGSLSPNAGAVGTPVTIAGTNFGATAGTVTFNGTPAAVASWTDTSIATTVPTGATSGNVVVTVSGTISNQAGFTVMAPTAPAIRSLSPTSGGIGTAVTITGVNFGTTMGTIMFHGTAASVDSWNSTSIATTVPSGATTGDVVVNVGSTPTNPVTFTITGKAAAPSITGLYPSRGVVNALVTIAGTNFGSTADTVTFNGTTAPIVSWSTSSITAKVPAGATSGNVVVTAGGDVSNGMDFTVGAPNTGSVSPAFFGFQCGSGYVTGANNCTDAPGTNSPTWPTSVAQPGLLRLWDSQVSWSYLMTGFSGGSGTYNWQQLDGYLDIIAAHQPILVNYVFGCVPSFIASGATGTTPGSCGPNGSATPPTDLTANGSPSFTQFVTDLMNHCSAAGNCVKNLITGYELWNEANVSSGATPRWTGTQLQLYQMMAPAAAIINSQVPNARILTPSITSGPIRSTPVVWMQTWLATEVSNGIISNYFNIHQYLNNSAPEDVASFWSGSISPNTSTSGWTPVPWIMGETSWDNVILPYGCNDGNTGTLFSTPDCIGQMVRWNLILMSNGSAGVYWYYWNTNIGQYSNYSTAFYNMMGNLQGGSFSAPCSSNTAGAWTCNFTKSDGTNALWVWYPNESGASYTVPAGYADYIDLTGNKTTVTAGSPIGINVAPIMLEQ